MKISTRTSLISAGVFSLLLSFSAGLADLPKIYNRLCIREQPQKKLTEILSGSKARSLLPLKSLIYGEWAPYRKYHNSTEYMNSVTGDIVTISRDKITHFDKPRGSGALIPGYYINYDLLEKNRFKLTKNYTTATEYESPDGRSVLLDKKSRVKKVKGSVSPLLQY